jgi:hypothetical protein
MLSSPVMLVLSCWAALVVAAVLTVVARAGALVASRLALTVRTATGALGCPHCSQLCLGEAHLNHPIVLVRTVVKE